jgi:uncharacterized delta-60 repeat protein
MALAFVLAPASAHAAAARPGGLDPSFGDHGVVATELPGEQLAPTAIARDVDGRIVVGGFLAHDGLGGDLVALRYLPSGALDPTFGAGGVARVHLSQPMQVTAMALQPDGKIVLAGSQTTSGSSQTASAVARLDANGALDTGFAGGGLATIDFAQFSADSFDDVVVQPDGKILAVGSDRNPGSHNEEAPTVARYEANGTPDGTFMGHGFGLLGNTGNLAGAVAVEPRGDALVVTSANAGSGAEPGSVLEAVRFGFGPVPEQQSPLYRWGVELASSRAYTLADGLAVRGDGRFVVTGTRTPGDSSAGDVFVFSVDSRNLTRIASRLVDIDGRDDDAAAVAVDGAGSAIVGRTTSDDPASSWQLALVRYRGAKLRLDRSFGRNGLALTDLGGRVRLEDIALQPDGKILALAHPWSLTSYFDPWGPPYEALLLRYDNGYDRRPPAIRIEGAAAVCRHRGVRVRVRDASPLAGVLVRLDGRKLRSTTRPRLTVRFPLSRLALRARRLSVVARDVAGNRAVARRRLPRCR